MNERPRTKRPEQRGFDPMLEKAPAETPAWQPVGDPVGDRSANLNEPIEPQRGA